MPKFKIALHKEIVKVGEILVLLTVDTHCHGQGLCSSVYDLVSMQHGKVVFLFIANCDRHLVRRLEEILVTVHIEGAFYIINSLDLHEMRRRTQ